MPDTTEPKPTTSPVDLEPISVVDALESLIDLFALDDETPVEDEASVDYQTSKSELATEAYDQILATLTEAKRSVDPSAVTEENIHAIIDSIAKRASGETDPNLVEEARVKAVALLEASDHLDEYNDPYPYHDIVVYYCQVVDGALTVTQEEADEAHAALSEVIKRLSNGVQAYAVLAKLYPRHLS